MRGTMTEAQMDAIREFGNIGGGHVATALSKMLDRRIEITVPAVRAVSPDAIPGLFRDPEEEVVVMLFTIRELPGGMVGILLPHASVVTLLEMLTGRSHWNPGALTPLTESALKEMGNILTGAYLTALAETLGLRLSQSVPAIGIDMAGALLETISTAAAGRPGTVYLVENEIIDRRSGLKLSFFLFCEDNLRTTLLSRAGMA